MLQFILKCNRYDTVLREHCIGMYSGTGLANVPGGDESRKTYHAGFRIHFVILSFPILWKASKMMFL